jgi:UDP-N-acetyl-D-galactosamine dehydrogenase
MGSYVVAQLVKAMTKKRIQIEGAKVLVMGLTFKENCPDLRNTRVVDIVAELKDYNCAVDVYDPWVALEDAQYEYGISPISEPNNENYDAIILAVAHQQFKDMGAASIRNLGKPVAVIYDLKYVLSKQESDLRL